MAELVDSTEGRGDGGERVGGELRRRQRFGRGEREMSRGRGRVRERGKGPGRRVASFQGIQTRRGEAGRQGGRWRGQRSARASARSCLARGGGEDDRGGGGLGHQLAGPACCCWAAQGEAPGKLLLFNFVFYFFLTFVLI